jgi:uncharacterized membrane protein YgaE (UPF0421/DUF939 family)
MSLAIRRGHRVKQISTAARTITQRAQVTLTLVSHRVLPAAVTIVRLVVCAVFAYLVALLVPGTSPHVLAPLTALLVLQVSIYQTLRSAVRRVASVVAGVLIALGLSAWVGFTWWSLGLTIALALAAGYALHLRAEVLEVPISAMLILSVGSRTAATGRIVETLIGTAAGLTAGFVLTSPRVQPAEKAIEKLGRTMADLLDQMAAGLSEESVTESARDWLWRARSLGNEIRRVDDALLQAEESTRLNPRSPRLLAATIALRENLETMEHAAIAVRVFARSLADCTRLAGDDNPVNDPDVRRGMADVLRELSAAVRTYSSLATKLDASSREPLKSELERHLAAARHQQGRLRELLAASSAKRAGWPLRGEMISHLDRLRDELEGAMPDRRARPRRNRSRRSPRARRRPLSQVWRRPRT